MVTVRRGEPNRREQIAALLVVLGAAIVFGAIIWLLGLWREAVARDPDTALGPRWLGEQISDHPYLMAGAVLLGVAFSGGLVMLILVRVAKRLAAWLTGGARSNRRGHRG